VAVAGPETYRIKSCAPSGLVVISKIVVNRQINLYMGRFLLF
jgi:hypothetical protein